MREEGDTQFRNESYIYMKLKCTNKILVLYLHRFWSRIDILPKILKYVRIKVNITCVFSV